MFEKTFFLDINGHEYQMPYWTFPWIAKAAADAKKANIALNLRAQNVAKPSESLYLWINPEDQINLTFTDPTDPEIPERLTSNETHQYMNIFEGDRRYGYRVLDLDSDDGEPIFHEWDDPQFR
ncbi:hypothetical protein [Corynebacterium mustelae]|uniref:hypothetical protein n=1 Tax=Corynebacterium mustelae TaxID=571915 RepID=UPI0006414B09|nr:hypothetical protein [Corynebacterium mustelae]